MQSQNEKERFEFTYSAREQEELKQIRKKYEPEKNTEEETKMETLRRLDEAVTQKATMRAILTGTAGALIMGTGMSLSMTDLSARLGFSHSLGMLLGILTGLIGIVLVGLAYPLYQRTLKAERKKIAPEILRLTEELMK